MKLSIIYVASLFAIPSSAAAKNTHEVYRVVEVISLIIDSVVPFLYSILVDPATTTFIIICKVILIALNIALDIWYKVKIKRSERK